MFDTVVVKASSALSPQEQMRAARFVREKAKGELDRGAVVDSGYPTSFSVVGELFFIPQPYKWDLVFLFRLPKSFNFHMAVMGVFSAAVGNETGTVYGVLKGHVEDLICTIEFLGASGLHENFVGKLPPL